MTANDKIKRVYTDLIQYLINASEKSNESIAEASSVIVNSLLSGHKVLTCANTNAESVALRFASLLVNKYEIERPCLPAIHLSNHLQHSALAGSVNADTQVYARQIQSFAEQQDVLVVFSLNNNEPRLIAAVKAALDKKLAVVVFTSGDGGEINALLTEPNVDIRLPTTKPSRVIETQFFVAHLLAELIDDAIFSM